MRGLSGKARESAVEEAVSLSKYRKFSQQTGIPLFGRHGPASQPGRRFVGSPSLILLDEPTAGIDEANRDAILVSVKSLQKSGRMVIMVNHYRPELESVCDRIITLKDGQLAVTEEPALQAL